MKTIEIESLNTGKNQVEVYYNHLPSGYGHWDIICQVRFNEEKKDFKKVTTDSEWIDSLSDLKRENPTSEQIQDFYHKQWVDSFDECVTDWIDSILDNEE